LAIDDYLCSLLVFCLQQPIQEKLDGFERFAVASDQTPAFFGVNLQGQAAAFTPGFLDLHDETEIAEHGVEQFFRSHLGVLRARSAVDATFSSAGIGWFLF